MASGGSLRPSSSAAAAAQQPGGLKQQEVPASYVARLLRNDVQKQVQQVLQMTACDWLRYFADLFPRLTMLLELCQRSDASPLMLEDSNNNSNNDASSRLDTPASTDDMETSTVQEAPMGLSARADYHRLQETIDSTATLVMLAYVFNHMPLLHACAASYNPGAPIQPTPKHWQRVADRLALTPTQELQWSICLAE